MYKYMIALIFITYATASASDKATDTIDVKIYTTEEENVNFAAIEDVTQLKLKYLSTERVDKNITPPDFYKKMAEQPQGHLPGLLYLIIKGQKSRLLTCNHTSGNYTPSLGSVLGRDEHVRKIIFVTPNNVCDVDRALAKKIATTRKSTYLEQVAKNMVINNNDI